MPRRHRWLAMLAGAVWMGAGVSGAMAADPAVDDRLPLIVNDDEETKAALPPVGPTGSATADPAVPPPVGGLKAEPEVIRKAIVEGATLLDPTAPLPGEAQARRAPGSDPSGDPLLPPNPGGAEGPSALSTLETSPAVKPVEPIMGSAPFAPESKPDGGPVMLGTELQSDGVTGALSPDPSVPGFIDGPLVEATDPWVFGVQVASVYDDNVQLSNTSQQQDFVFVLSASIAWQWGDVRLKRGSWARVFYEATGIMFADQSDEDTLDHDVQAGVQKRAGRLSAALEGRYRRLSGATPDLGDRVERDEYRGKLGGSYELSGRTFLEGNVAWNAVHYLEAGLQDYREFLGEMFAGYEVSGRTRVAVGGAAGQLKVSGEDKQNFQRALVKVTRASTGALGLTGKAGAEFRQTQTGNRVTPVFSVAADYEPIEDSTRVTGEVFRETVSSGALAGENYLRTGGALRLTQRLGSRFVAGLEGGYERLDYVDVEDNASSGRVDNYFYAKPSLKYEFNNRRRAEVFYSFREDDSSLDAYSFTGNQWGLSVGLDF